MVANLSPGDRATPKVSVVLPCLNEAEHVGESVRQARRMLAASGLDGEVVVVDNGSTDGSGNLASAAGARVVDEPKRGYGAALRAGFAAADGDVIVMADADGSYDLADAPRFIEALDRADLVVGDRMDAIEAGAMPWLHRYVGNPALSRLLRMLHRTGVRDAHCGMRALRADAVERLELQSNGMELASEMVIRAVTVGLTVRELPITYHPRRGTSKLSTFRDGWRHLRLLLVYAPVHVFVVPGVVLTVIGAVTMVSVLAQLQLFGRSFYVHTMVAGSLATVAGAQIVGLGLCAQTYAADVLGHRVGWFDRSRTRLRLEHGLVIAVAFLIAGVACCATVLSAWADHGFTRLSEERVALAGSTLIILGLQVFFTSFLLSILGLRRRR